MPVLLSSCDLSSDPSRLQAVDEVTKVLDDIKGEITDRKRAKVRHAALAAVAVAKAAQLDAEIRLAEEKLCLLEEQEAANPDQVCHNKP